MFGGNFLVFTAKWLGLLVVIMIIAAGALVCRSTSGTPTPRPTLQPTSTPVPLPTPALAVEDCDGSGYCGRLEAGVRVTAAAWLDDDRMYLAGWDGSIRLLNVETGDVATALEGLAYPRGLTYPQGLTVLGGRLYVTDVGNACQLMQEL